MDLGQVRVFLGYDPRETVPFVVADKSIRAHTTSADVRIERLALAPLQSQGLYTRRMHVSGNQRWDTLSDAPISTDHALARFWVPLLCGYQGWALFMDGDILVRRNLAELFALADPGCAVQVVQHQNDAYAIRKKDGDLQTVYPRKNWSSVMLLNCGHSAWRSMDAERLNTSKGLYLHGFNWMLAGEVGALPPEWNALVGVTRPFPEDPAIVHYTLGTPDLVAKTRPDLSDELPYAADWWFMARAAGYDLPEDPVNREVRV